MPVEPCSIFTADKLLLRTGTQPNVPGIVDELRYILPKMYVVLHYVSYEFILFSLITIFRTYIGGLYYNFEYFVTDECMMFLNEYSLATISG